ncbi:MAG: hypothetical protein MZU97_27055 [Bacillus subtilis]|nr:hypothetical protein [Bacillus subtilis]
MLRKAFQEAAFKRMVFMLQLEVAQKVCAKAGDEGYGPISIARWAIARRRDTFRSIAVGFRTRP